MFMSRVEQTFVAYDSKLLDSVKCLQLVSVSELREKIFIIQVGLMND